MIRAPASGERGRFYYLYRQFLLYQLCGLPQRAITGKLNPACQKKWWAGKAVPPGVYKEVESCNALFPLDNPQS